MSYEIGVEKKEGDNKSHIIGEDPQWNPYLGHC